jgi:hypothetical protein
MKRWPGVILLSLLIAAVPARAAPSFTVEVIAFRYSDAAQASMWAADEQVPALGGATPLREAVKGESPDYFTALPASALRLGGASAVLRKTAGYEVLLHTAWRQPGRAAGPISLSSRVSPEEVEPALEGTLRLREAGPEIRVSGEFWVLLGTQRVKVSPNQNLRVGELRYIDHALLGLLVQVLPETTGETATAEPATAPLETPPLRSAATPGPAD